LTDPVIDEVLFGLQRQRDAYEANGATKEAQKFDEFCDAVQSGRAIVLGRGRLPMRWRERDADCSA
jgi:hypothetical protein